MQRKAGDAVELGLLAGVLLGLLARLIALVEHRLSLVCVDEAMLRYRATIHANAN